MGRNLIRNTSENSKAACIHDSTPLKLKDSGRVESAGAQHSDSFSGSKLPHSSPDHKNLRRIQGNLGVAQKKHAAYRKGKTRCLSVRLKDCRVPLVENCGIEKLYHELKSSTVQSSFCVKALRRNSHIQQSQMHSTSFNSTSCQDNEGKHNQSLLEDEGSAVTVLKARLQEKNDEINELRMKIISLQDKIPHLRSFNYNLLT